MYTHPAHGYLSPVLIIATVAHIATELVLFLGGQLVPHGNQLSLT